MEKVREVHIVPVWREYDRVVEPIREYRPDRVYLLAHDDQPANSGEYCHDLRDELCELVPRVDLVELDLFDMYDVMGAVTTLADTHAGERVRVNVTGGTKRAAIGASMACMDRGTNAEPYVVEPGERPAGIDDPLTSGYDSASLMTMYSIHSPSRDQVIAMAVIDAYNTNTRKTKLRTVIDKGRQWGIAGLDPEADRDKGDYAKLRSRITEDLEERGYIEIVERSTRCKHVRLTGSGYQTLRSFRHRAENVIQTLEDRSGTDLTLDNPVEESRRLE
ncbi:HFX_2341 family transcriptional regulator domain-containing protein [Salinigranum salinum]|uniref:HFX_2341 family transcriptional regulator domain-containing protein n=1 Tax=Salinigranum salinum TaxID=1364937 RepID=UPI001260FCFF|nr:DUF6293 family protein [Salinigranum salinum]